MALLTCVGVLVMGVCACGGAGSNPEQPNNPEGNQPQQFSGITFEDGEFTYDGQSHSIAVGGSIPANTTISYENNGQTNVGEYTVKANLSKDGYESKTVTATLKINKAEFVGVTLESKKFIYMGKPYSLEVSGDIPENTQITYTGNDQKEVGEHTVTATLTNPNYITKTLTATLTINAKTDIALAIINGLFKKPEPWSFLPDALSPESMGYSTMPIGGREAFASDVNVSQIANKSIGKQFYVLYEGLCDATSTINKLDSVFAISATLADVYQTFINNNPDDYATFTGAVGGFKVKIALDGNKSTLLAGNSTVNIELEYDGESEQRTARIQVTDGMAVKYTAAENSLKLAVKKTVSDVGNIKQIEFAQNQGAVAGYLREFTGTETKNLKTTGVFASNENYTVIMSDKRETEDMVITGYEEVYSSVTGEYLGGRVQETVKFVNYDTLWLHLSDVSGFNKVRIEEKSNGLNLDSVFINGQSTTLETKKVNPIIPTSSRRYDVEMKEVWYVVAKTNNGKTEYELEKTLIPMLFVQTEQTENFATDIKEKNSYMTNVQLPTAQITATNTYFTQLKELFDSVKESVTYEEIQTYIGEKNEFFNA